MKVITKDFQRLAGENTFEFPVGITVIQGRSGSGKSTVFYAVEDCLMNPSGVADVINWDAKNCSVTIENNGNAVTWVKTPTSCTYIDADGKEYVKASKMDSRDLTDLGFYFDKNGDVINIHSEWSKLFPFELKDTEMFRLFEDIFNISSSFQIIDSIKADEKDLKGKIDSVHKQLDLLTTKSNAIATVLSTVDLDVDKYIQNISKTKLALDELQQALSVYEQNQKYINLEIPTEYSLQTVLDKAQKCNLIQNTLHTYLNNKTLQDIVLPDMYDITPFNVCADKLKALALDEQSYQVSYQNAQMYERGIIECEGEIANLNEQLANIKVCPTCGRPL